MNDVTAMKRALNTARAGQQITAKHALEGATTLVEAAIQLELLVRYWMQLHTLGWTLAHPVKDGASTLVEPEGWQR